MGLTDYISDKERFGDKKYEAFLKLKKKFQEKGLPENIAVYKATEVLTPEKLEKIKILIKNEDGLRIGVVFFFDSEEDLIAQIRSQQWDQQLQLVTHRGNHSVKGHC